MFAAFACSTASFLGLKPDSAARKYMAQAKRCGAHIWSHIVWPKVSENAVPRRENTDAVAYCIDDIRRS